MTRCTTLLAVVAAVLLIGTVRSAGADEVEEFHAYLLPETAFTEPGGMVEVRFEVDATARQFNGYEIILRYDPGIVSFESVEEGSLMTEACDNRFTNLETTDSTVTFSHVLLCAGVSVDGPGLLSTFRFRGEAVGSTPLEIISDPDRTFFDDGLYVWPNHPTFPRQVILHSDSLRVLDPTTGAEEAGGGGPPPFRVTLLPNPLREAGRIRIGWTGPIAPARVALVDVAGRSLRDWELPPSQAGEARIDWRAVDRSGRPLPAGTYFVRVEMGGQVASGRFLILR